MFELGRKQLWMLVGFVLMTLALNTAMNRLGFTLLQPYVHAMRAQRLYAYLTREHTEDVLIIGSSRVAGGLDARMLGRDLSAELGRDTSVYKLGIPGIRPLVLSEVLETAVKRRPPNELLVLAIETRNFVVPANAASVRRAARQALTGDEVRGEWEADEVIAGFWRQFDGLKALWNLSWMASEATSTAADFQQQHGGEHLTVEERRRVEALQARQRRGRPDLFDLPPGKAWKWSEPGSPDIVGWQRVLEICEELPCKVIFVRMPLQLGFNEQHMPLVSRRFADEIVGQLTARGFEFHDLNLPPYPSDPQYFAGITHLNRRGCEETSRVIVPELIAPQLRGLRKP